MPSLLVVALILAASPKAAPARPAVATKPAPITTAVSKTPLVVDIPAHARPHDPKLQVLPGYRSDDGAIFFTIVDSTGESMEVAKKSIEELEFIKWIQSEKAGDGYLLTWKGGGLDEDGGMTEKYFFRVAKKIGTKTFDCRGVLKSEKQLEANLAICKTLRSK